MKKRIVQRNLVKKGVGKVGEVISVMKKHVAKKASKTMLSSSRCKLSGTALHKNLGLRLWSSQSS